MNDDELIEYVVGTQAIEGIQTTQESIDRMRRVLAGELTADEAVEEVLQKKPLPLHPHPGSEDARYRAERETIKN